MFDPTGAKEELGARRHLRQLVSRTDSSPMPCQVCMVRDIERLFLCLCRENHLGLQRLSLKMCSYFDEAAARRELRGSMDTSMLPLYFQRYMTLTLGVHKAAASAASVWPKTHVERPTQPSTGCRWSGTRSWAAQGCGFPNSKPKKPYFSIL